ncbi:MAG: choice-of-anchor J domain-containing protein [Bacteroidales bacterium]|nr:choice-of-anchor J domain-containing protein [Bacteroidales bacterium]
MKRKLTFLLTALLLLTGMSLQAQNYTWESTELSDLTSSDVFVIVGNNGSNYAMINSNGTTSAPSTVAVTVSGNALTGEIADNIQWTISGDATNGYIFYPNGSTTTWLYCTNTNNGVRIGTNTNNLFKVDTTSNYLINQATSRYIGIYNSQDWRCYTTINNNITGQTFTYYKRVSGTSQNPYIAADNVEIEYDATNGSIDYSINNPVSGGVLTANTNSDWLTIGTVGTTVPFTCTNNELATERTASVTLTYTYNTNQTVTKNVTVTQNGNPNVINTISDITAAGTYVVQGTIVAKSSRGFIVGDGTGYIYYYNTNYPQSSYAIGDMVRLSGSVVVYGGVYEFNNTTTVTPATTSNYVTEEPTVITGEEMDARVASTTPAQLSSYVQYVGTLTVSGNYYNITNIEGAATAKGSISYPIDTDFASLNGQQVVVTGYYVGISSSQYYNTMLGSIEAIEVSDPDLNLSVNVLNDFRYMVGEGPSAAKNFTISGSNLTTEVTLTAPADFELSLFPDAGYFDSDELSPVEGTLAETTVYVRLKAGLEVGDYTGELSIVSGDLSETITLNGTVTRLPSALNANVSSLTGFTYEFEEGGPSDIQSFLIGGDYLTDNVAVYPSESFEVSTMPSAMFRPENPAMIFIPNSGHFYDININVRMKAGLEAGEYDEQIYAVSEGADTLFINVSGTVTGGTPTPPPTPTEGNYVRINDLSQLTEGAYVVFAARFDDNATDYYAMSNQSSGKPTGVLFTSATSGSDEVLPASIVDEESSYYWVVGVTSNGYTFTNANGELIGWSSGTNFTTGGDNIEWSIENATAGESAMVPNYTGFTITNIASTSTNTTRGFALNSQHNFGPYATSNNTGSGYNFYLDIFVKTEGGEPPMPTVATPTFTPEAGTYYEAQTVSIACATPDATIHYTLDGTDPTASSPVYTTPINIETTTTIKAIAMKEGYNDSNIATATYTIQMGFVTIFNQDWEGEMNGWTFVDVEGEAQWSVATYQGNHYAYANGYNHGANEDWCISPAFNLNAYSNPILSFRTAKNYTGNDLQVFFSNNYNGTNPATATWTELTCALSTGGYAWTESGDIDLSAFSGTNCYIGFKYTCEEDGAAAWEVDDILLLGQTSAPVVSVTPLSLTGFTYIEGNGPSAEQSFTVSGMNLSGNITISEATDYEISLLSGDDFTAQSTLTLSATSGNVEETTVFVRLKAGLAVGEYNGEDIAITCADVDEIDVTCSGTVTAQPVPGDDYVRISDVSELAEGNRVVFAARFDGNANDYYAMSNTASGKPEGVLFTSAMNGSDEILPSSIIGEEDNFYWTVSVTADGYTFTNANGDMIGYTSSTNFAPNGDNTAWSIEISTSEETAMVPNYTGFVISNVNNPNRAFALNSNHNFGPYHIQNMAGENYNFFLDIFMQGEGGMPTVAAPTFEPAAGTYYETIDVTLSCATSGATIYYSLDSENGPWDEYEEAITVDESMTIWAYAEKDDYNDSPVVSAEYVIQAGLTIIFNQDWEEEWHGWTEVNVAGDSLWRIASYQGNHYAYANGYNHPATEDWLISPAFDLDSYSDVVLTFRTAMNYNGPDIEVFFSNDYDGQDPTAATWQELECELSGGSWEWTESGEISLNGFSGSNCYIGFKYTCTDEEAAGWEVDDIMLASGSNTNPTLSATPNTINGFSYIEGEGPSTSQSYNLTGANLLGEGDIMVLVTEGFEISLDDETYGEELEIAYADGQIVDQPVTIYVRMAEGLEVGSYDGTIMHEGGEAYTEVSLAGVVHSEDEPAIDAFMPLYIQGNNGSNNNRVPVATAVYIGNLEPNTTYRYTNQFVDDNDGPETAGAGNVIYANPEGFYRSTSPSLATEGGYGEFTTDEDGIGFAWFINEPTANARFTPGNHVYLRIRINDGHDGTTVSNIFTTEDYATVLNFGNEVDEYSGSAFYAKSDEAPMSFAMMFATDDDWRPTYSTPIETTGVDYGSINQYADFYKELVAGQDGWFGGILPNDNENGINIIWILDLESYVINDYYTEGGEWMPEAHTVNPTNGLDEPIFIDLTYDGVEEQQAEANVKVWSADHEFVIENGDNAHYTMTVYNLLGQPMMQQQINAGSTQRIGHNLAAGLYVVSLQNTQNNVSVKVIVR